MTISKVPRTYFAIAVPRLFRTLSEVREHTEQWLADYNQEVPHDSLGGLTPAEFRLQNEPMCWNVCYSSACPLYWPREYLAELAQLWMELNTQKS